MADSRRPVLLMTLSRPTSTERICVTRTVSCRWMGNGMRQFRPALRVESYLPKVVTTACSPSRTMKMPLASQITTATAAIMPTPMPAPFMSG